MLFRSQKLYYIYFGLLTLFVWIMQRSECRVSLYYLANEGMGLIRV